MRVECHPSPGASARNAASDFIVLDLAGADLGQEAVIAAVVTQIYSHAREGGTVIVTKAHPALATACSEVGLAFRVVERATREAAQGADVVIVDQVDLEEAPVATLSAPRGCRLRVAVAGLGLIGEGVALRLAASDADYALTAALVREPFKERRSVRVDQITNDLSVFFATRPDVVIDALPDGAAGRALIEAALDRGVNVISANKQAVAGAVEELLARASASGATLRFSASVGGGAPFIETAARARRNGAVRKVEAVLNGTVNFILTSLARGETFADAVKAAQAAGFAEPDPSADLSGADARAKISILSHAAFGEEIDLADIDIESLDAETAARLIAEGGCWKQVARLKRYKGGRPTASVRYERRDGDRLFEDALFEANALRITLEDGRIVECRGKGAGRRPTVESILGDLGEIRRARLAARSLAENPLVRAMVPA